MGSVEYGLPETSGYLFFSLCKTTDKQNRGGREGEAKETSVGVKAAQSRSQGVRKFQSRQPAGRSTWRAAVCRRGQERLPAGKRS